MKISPELEKKFLEVSIKLSKTDKDNAFFRRRDPNILINLAKVHISRGNKKVTLVNLRALYKKDSDIRVALFGLIQNIEEKLTGVIAQRISYDHPDYHLHSINFNLMDKNNTLFEFKNINTFIFNLRREHKYMIDNSYSIPKNGYIPMESFISKISLGLKAKLLKYSKLEYRNTILNGFGIKQNQEADFTIDFMAELNSLRNNVMHHETVTDWVWKSKFGEFDIFEFIEIATYFTAEFDMSSLDGIRKKPFLKCSKAKMVKITSGTVKKDIKNLSNEKVVTTNKKVVKIVNDKQIKNEKPQKKVTSSKKVNTKTIKNNKSKNKTKAKPTQHQKKVPSNKKPVVKTIKRNVPKTKVVSKIQNKPNSKKTNNKNIPKTIKAPKKNNNNKNKKTNIKNTPIKQINTKNKKVNNEQVNKKKVQKPKQKQNDISLKKVKKIITKQKRR